MAGSRAVTDSVPVDAADHVLCATDAAVTVVEFGFFVNGTIQDVSFGLHNLFDATAAVLRARED